MRKLILAITLLTSLATVAGAQDARRPVYGAKMLHGAASTRPDANAGSTLTLRTNGSVTGEQLLAAVRQGVKGGRVPRSCFRFDVAMEGLNASAGKQAMETLPAAFLLYPGAQESRVELIAAANAGKSAATPGAAVCVRSGCVQDCSDAKGGACRTSCTVSCSPSGDETSAHEVSRNSVGTKEKPASPCSPIPVG